MTATIRRAGAEDVAALASLKLRTFREAFVDDGFRIPYPPADLSGFEAETYGETRIAAELADPTHRSWIAERDGAMLGYVHVGPCKLPHADVRPGEGEVYQLYVDRAARGEKLGQRLFEIALGWLDQACPGSLWLGVWSGNLKAQRFYRHHGFEPVGEYLFPVGTWHDREYIYRRL